MHFLRFVPLVVYCVSSLSSAAELTMAANMSSVRELVIPSDDEITWLKDIPWETNLDVARAKAQAAGRPIFLWEMDGHPLGCT
ncbi:MAG: hypothetical protein O3C21_08565 [Verrucomicrobia bacterium]|nr:hypothetical protein [Verrucomicrobiota bacterium]